MKRATISQPTVRKQPEPLPAKQRSSENAQSGFQTTFLIFKQHIRPKNAAAHRQHSKQ
ncbi:hypothetical protein MCC93_12220 [Morococcus cerebrosus]|uniref:Uncharacterized protein n=1 Tax=Morococcus cerebrosus TaxID=1056807 RepID=A0A0C1H1S8_9NEIS|nr:hypothetical protein MCC93_12220 [Morococcus cerebrosus]